MLRFVLIGCLIPFSSQGCCSYGVSGFGSSGYDCVNIPGASSINGMQAKNNNFCGGDLVTHHNGPRSSVCRNYKPHSGLKMYFFNICPANVGHLLSSPSMVFISVSMLCLLEVYNTLL